MASTGLPFYFLYTIASLYCENAFIERHTGENGNIVLEQLFVKYFLVYSVLH